MACFFICTSFCFLKLLPTFLYFSLLLKELPETQLGNPDIPPQMPEAKVPPFRAACGHPASVLPSGGDFPIWTVACPASRWPLLALTLGRSAEVASEAGAELLCHHT